MQGVEMPSDTVRRALRNFNIERPVAEFAGTLEAFAIAEGRDSVATAL